ncbi:hypothetical protein F2Q69_00032476 [Brassica cretica]|uniref:Uncharacterized protein n=2 Tax=Brassica cretica TaxID=69181 RepID=A0A8S9S2H3_BRACR|nr:hypothetical protein F2Q69_00032476 [Brassica cretica]KAF3608658.1 hypothetical protein DY000_02051560 [Brassica cretica]
MYLSQMYHVLKEAEKPHRLHWKDAYKTLGHKVAMVVSGDGDDRHRICGKLQMEKGSVS